MITLNNISKSYTIKNKKSLVTINALKNVSFTAQDGQITALVGPNGAGKTTALKILAGLTSSSSGTASINGLTGHSLKLQLGFFTDTSGLYQRLSAYENIQYFADLFEIENIKFENTLNSIDNYLNLKKYIFKRVEQLSQGERMKVALARSLIHDPQTIVLDEPTNGLDVTSVRGLRELLLDLKRSAHGCKCILISTHVMSEVVKIADKVIILSKGKVIANDNVKQICEQAGTTDFEEAFTTLILQDEYDTHRVL